jgi:hypothetical protein
MSKDFALTPLSPDHSISPESSDGFASVGTILPKEKAALLPGGLFISEKVVSPPNGGGFLPLVQGPGAAESQVTLRYAAGTIKSKKRRPT